MKMNLIINRAGLVIPAAKKTFFQKDEGQTACGDSLTLSSLSAPVLAQYRSLGNRRKAANYTLKQKQIPIHVYNLHTYT